MGEWREVTLGDVLTLQRGFDLPARDREDGPVPVVSSSGVTGRHSVSKVDPPGVVIGRYGSLGSVHWVEEPFWPLNTALWVKDFKGNDPRYVSYLLQTINTDSGSAAAVPGVNRNHLHRLTVRVPPLGKQRLIGAVIGAFDDLILTNQRRIDLTAATAERIYREWFVHFRFPDYHQVSLVNRHPHGRMPTAWTVEHLFDVADVAFGYPFRSKGFSDEGPYPIVRIRDVPHGTTDTFTDEAVDSRYLVEDGDVLIGMDGIFHLRQWSGGQAWLNQRVARLRPKKCLSARHLMLAIAEPLRSLNEAITGTTVAHLGKRHLEEIRVIRPAGGVLEQATEMFDAMAALEQTLSRANRHLVATRDLLLPRLVSGQLDISDVDLGALTPVEEAA